MYHLVLPLRCIYQRPVDQHLDHFLKGLRQLVPDHRHTLAENGLFLLQTLAEKVRISTISKTSANHSYIRQLELGECCTRTLKKSSWGPKTTLGRKIVAFGLIRRTEFSARPFVLAYGIL